MKWPEQKREPDPDDRDLEMALQFVERNTQVAWVLRNQFSDAHSPWQVRLSLDDLVEPLLRDHVNDGTFDALIIAAPDGRVVFQTGAAPLQVVHLARLVASKDVKGVRHGHSTISRCRGHGRRVVAGGQSKLFTQPCCGVLSTGCLSVAGRSPARAVGCWPGSRRNDR